MVAYIDKINELYRKMFGILPDILPANRMAANQYLEAMWTSCYRTTAAFEYRYVVFSVPSAVISLTLSEGQRMTDSGRCSTCARAFWSGI
jgi:hypothetical protein